MLDLSLAKIVKQGILLYDGVLEYKVIIIESDILYGADDDYEDPPELAEDKECRCYYAWCDSPLARGKFNSGWGVFLSLEEAIQEIEKESYFAYWIENEQELLDE